MMSVHFDEKLWGIIIFADPKAFRQYHHKCGKQYHIYYVFVGFIITSYTPGF